MQGHVGGEDGEAPAGDDAMRTEARMQFGLASELAPDNDELRELFEKFPK